MDYKYRIILGILSVIGLCNAAINLRPRRSIDLSATHPLIPDARLPKNVVPTNYNLEIAFDLGEEQKITAVMTMNLTFNEKADQISFHADRSLELDDRKINLLQYVNKTDGITMEKMPFRRADYMPKKNVFIIYLKDDYNEGTICNLQIKYETYLWQGSEGLFKGSYQYDGKTFDYYATYMRPHNARKLFPCFDEPGFKVPFNVSISRPKDYVALFNTPVVNTENKGDFVIDHFEKTPPMSSFTFGLILTQLEKYHFETDLEGSITPINFWATKTDKPESEIVIKETYNKTIRIMEFLQNYFSAKLPLSKVDLVGVPTFSPMRPADNWGLLIFKESELFKKTYYGLAQELTYQWLGSWVTPFWWSDAHINKALASFLASYAVIELDNGKEFNGKYPMTVLYSLYYEFSKRYPHSRITGMKQETTSFKTELVIRMLNYTLGSQTFKTGIRSFLANNHYGTFFGDDLWNHLTKQAHKDNMLDKKYIIADIANSWITKDRLPVIKVTRNYKEKTATVEQKVYLRERPHDVPEQDKMLWWVPLVIISEDNLDFSNSTPFAWIEKQRLTTISNLPGEGKFIIVNPEEIGPFPVNYDEQNWQLLSNYLQKEEGRLSIPTYTRAKLLHDAWNLAYAGDLSFATAFDMTMFMKYERNHIVWNPIFTFIDHIGRHIDMSKVYKKFETYVRVLLTPLYEELGEPKDGEENWKNDLRSLSKTFLCRAGYKPCIEEAQKEFKVWMESSDPDDGVPISNECICPVFKWGTMEEWEFGLQRVINFRKENAQSSRTYLLKTLAGCPVQHEKVEKLLKIAILDGNGNFTENDIFLIFNMLTGGSSGYTSLFNFLSNNWVTIKQKFENKTNLWDSLISSATGVFTTQEGYEMVKKLYEERKGEFGSAEHIIKKSLTNIKEEAKWSDENLPIIEKWLDKFLTTVNQEDTKFMG